MRVQADAINGALPRDARRLHVAAASTQALRAALSGPLAGVRSRRVTIDVASWEAPQPAWSGRLGPLPGVVRHEIRLPDAGPGQARVRVVLTTAVPFALVAAAALQALTLVGRLPMAASPDVAAHEPPPWLPPWQNVAGNPVDAEAIVPYDLLLADGADLTGAGLADPPAGPMRTVSRSWGAAGTVVVDATVVNPRGHLADSDVDAALVAAADRFTVRAGAADFTDSLALLSPRRLATVRALRSVRVDTLDAHDPPGQALLLVQLAMAGVLVHTPTPLPGAVAARLAAELLERFAEPLPAPDAPTTVWEARSVQQRRTALREHATAFALPALAGFPDALRTPSVTALLVVPPGRPLPDLLRALALIKAQTYPALEVLLATSTATVDSTVEAADVGHPLRVFAMPPGQREEAAYASAAVVARGNLVTRWELGAHYGPEHVWDLVLALHYSGAAVVGKACEFYRPSPDAAPTSPPASVAEDTVVEDAVVRPGRGVSERFVESLSDGPLLLSRADLAAAGGWPQAAAGPGYLTHSFGFVRPARQGLLTSRSETDIRTFPLTVVTS